MTALLHRAALAAIAAATVAGAATLPAAAASTHDGTWSVKTSAETGQCATNYELKLAVKNGKVSYAGMWPVKAKGGVNAVGLINMDISHGSRRVTATGLVRGDSASGDWTSPQPACSGSWVARRA
ncbi:hypothetical protein [Bosea sp. 117]|uniref:hypothetical protein n=1 Tax=Bosea sp. 117 TaxID=1125973 RepID=UPI000493EAC3|nr:hypothetical protein [Bosea sp. 117]